MMRTLSALSLVGFAAALISDLVVNNDDRSAFHISSFGFETGGVFRAEIKDFSLMVPHDYTPPPDGSFNIAFVLQRSPSDTGVRLEDIDTVCFHEHHITPADDVISLSSREKWNKVNFEKTIVEPGYYHLYFSNCEKTVHSTFELKTEEYNIDGGQKVYLSTGLSSLPTWFGFITVIFVAMSIAWGAILKKNWSNVKSIHWLMLVVCILKIFTLIFETVKFHNLKVHGVNDGWVFLFYFFSALKGMLMFAVIVLIGTGWSYLKPFLTERDKQLMLAVLVVQAMVNVAMVIVDEATPGSAGGVTWRDLLHLLDIICCCVILLPIVWSIRHLRNASGGNTADGKAVRNMTRLKNFRTFYLLVVSYIYFTRIIVFLLEATLPFELSWIGPVFNEIAAMIFYGVTGYLFRPQDSNPYLALSKDDDDIRLDQLGDDGQL